MVRLDYTLVQKGFSVYSSSQSMDVMDYRKQDPVEAISLQEEVEGRHVEFTILPKIIGQK